MEDIPLLVSSLRTLAVELLLMKSMVFGFSFGI
jgi:hypothetical protein